MTKIFDFTIEETNLIAMFERCDNRIRLMKLIAEYDGFDEESRRIALSVMDKLARMTDAEYNDTSFEAAL